MNAKFDTTRLPTVANAVNRLPAIGDQTVIQGRFTFRLPRTDNFGGISLQRADKFTDRSRYDKTAESGVIL